MNVKEIIKKFLNDNKYDGLYNKGECSCHFDDKFPCDLMEGCEPGIKLYCKTQCPYDVQNKQCDYEFCIGEKNE